MSEGNDENIHGLPVRLDRDVFLRRLLRELSGTLEEVVGVEECAGFISVVGQRIGDEINDQYKEALGLPVLSRQQVASVLVDLKRRIQGDFYVLEETDDKIVLGNRRCPFGRKVVGRPSLCMMTSNVFGVIAAQNLGQAKVSIDESIAMGAEGCLVTIYLRPSAESDAAIGREYFKG